MLRKLLKSAKGFTLVELMVVVLIIAILVAIAVPVFNASRNAARNRTCQANRRTLDGALQTYNSDNDGYPPSGTTLSGALVTTYVKAISACPHSTGGTGNACYEYDSAASPARSQTECGTEATNCPNYTGTAGSCGSY